MVIEDQLGARVEPDIERALYFIAFEALSSAPRAGAHEVRVRLERSETALVLRVDDDGVPLDDPGRSLALQNLLDRAAVADAVLEVVEAPSGLHLVCNVGLPDLAPADESENTDVTAVPLGAGQ